jgi:hypothetical protein
MKIRKGYIIPGVLIVVLTGYLFLKNNDRSLYELPVLAPIETSLITRIEIETPDKQILLSRKGSGWVVGQNAYTTDEKRLQKITDMIVNLTITTLIAESRNYARYELDKEHRIAITAWNGDQRLREFEVGKRASSSRHTFVRLAQDHRVFHARGDIRHQFEISMDDVRDKTVLSFDGSQIHTIRIRKGDRTGVYVKAAGSDPATPTGDADEPAKPWKTEQEAPVQDRVLDTLVDQISRLTCRQFVYGHSRSDFKDPLFTLTLEGNEVYTLTIFERLTKGGADYPAISSQTDDPFLLPKWQANRFMLNPDDIPLADESHQQQG